MSHKRPFKHLPKSPKPAAKPGAGDPLEPAFREAFGVVFSAARNSKLSADEHQLVHRAAAIIEQALAELSGARRAKAEAKKA